MEIILSQPFVETCFDEEFVRKYPKKVTSPLPSQPELEKQSKKITEEFVWRVGLNRSNRLEWL